MAEKAGRGSERKRSGKGRAMQVWRDRLSFAATLVTVSAVAIFLGWLLGQYAIQAVTGPVSTATMAERPATPSPSGSSTPAAGSSTATSPASSSSSSSGGPAAASTGGFATATQAASPATAASGGSSAAGGSGATTGAASSTTATSGLWRVQVGAFNDRNRADALASELRARGFDVFVTGAPPHRVQVGAFSAEARARATADDLRALGYEAIVIPPG